MPEVSRTRTSAFRSATLAAAAALLPALTASCVLLRQRPSGPSLPDGAVTFTPAGQFSIAPLGRFPPRTGLRFGGISGLAPLAGGREMLGISDDHVGRRIYRFRLDGSSDTFTVTPLDYISLEQPAGNALMHDPEGLVIAPDGNLIVSSEGNGGIEPRLPPSLVEFGAQGQYIRQIAVPDRFRPNPTGPLTKGARANYGFEAIAIAPDGSRLFAASETALAQDGDLTTVQQGAPARLVEFVRRDETYVPAREFVYLVEPLFQPPFEIGLAVNGLVDFLALGDERLLAMERIYMEEAGNTGRGLNRIRIFRVDLTGATDVSAVESLRDAGGVTPVTKTPFLDLSSVPGLSPELVPGLDNFEGMAFGPRLPDGRTSLVLVSDDNFNPKQRTWFVMLGLGRPGLTDPSAPARARAEAGRDK
jgi:hypothetical protein